MSLPRNLPCALLLAGCAAGPAPNPEVPDLSGVVIQSQHVAGPVYFLEATGDVAGNVAASIGPDGVLLVDTQFAELADQLRDALDALGAGPITYVANSHYHLDHAGGNGVLGPEATIIGPYALAERLADRPASARPTMLFEGEHSLEFNGEEVRFLHLPGGHTDTDVVVHFTGSNVLHLGDLYNAGVHSFPNIDIGAGGSVAGLLAALESLLEWIPADALIIPGHYELSDRDGLRACRDMVVATTRYVREQKRMGASVEAIQERGLPAEYEAWGHTGYTDADAWIENLYEGL